MATNTAGQIVFLPNQVDTDASPMVGRLIVVATNANIIQLLGAPGDVQGDPGTPGALSVTDAQLANWWYDILPDLANPPMSIGVVDLGAEGQVKAFVLKSFILAVDAEATNPFVNPFTGEALLVTTTWEVLYVQALAKDGCASPSVSLTLGGQRMTIINRILPVPAQFPAPWTNTFIGTGETTSTIIAGA
jgi:hypothetical protein